MASSEQKLLERATLVVASFASFATPFIGSATNIALPSIGKAFSADAVTLSWVATSFLLSAAVFLTPFGRIADLFGRKKVLNAGLIVFTIASLLCALSQGINGLIFWRVIQGIGGAMIFGTAMAIITSVFPREKRGKALGIAVASVYTGLTLGPFIGGYLTKSWGWQGIFLFTVPLGIIAVTLSFIYLKQEWADARGEKFDWKGSMIYGLAIIALMYGFGELPSISGAVFTLLGFAGITLFVLFEKKQTYPVLNIQLFHKNKIFAFSNYAALINYSATFAIGFLLSLYLQYIKGLNPQQAGQILVIQPLLMAIFSPLTGKLSDKMDPGKIASIGMAFISAGLFIIAFIGLDTSILFISIILVLFGVGYALFSSPNTNAIMGAVDKKYYGIASSTLGTMRLVGQMSSMGIAMMIFSIFIGKVEINPSNHVAFINALRTAFIIFAVLCFMGIFFSLARGKNNPRSS
ncbi:MAG: MFS transporter [Bacteroidales bacterium]|jgi:EmrB/QacA subfamily drug resistance transporter|nr:MFS transporter [Bacteroidales bacterium]